jgi:hypothetical protein
VWFTTEAIAPQIVQAYTARVDLALDRLPEENYETVLRRAEAVARAAAQRTFDQDILVTEVSIIVSVENQGAIAPVIALNVSRLQWKQRPDPQRWATYFKSARSLLFFEQQTSPPDPAPNSVPSSTPVPGSTSVPGFNPTPSPSPTPTSGPTPNSSPVPDPVPTPVPEPFPVPEPTPIPIPTTPRVDQ